uniref:Uncharacterized protein n=1 Tax=Lotus japonicus TaxID=34305 RepID=I3SA37_LOTJA|nr:unknown [Lotus japonicus]
MLDKCFLRANSTSSLTTLRTKGSRIGSSTFLTDCNFITSRTTLEKGGGFLRLSSELLPSSAPLLSDMTEEPEAKRKRLCGGDGHISNQHAASEDRNKNSRTITAYLYGVCICLRIVTPKRGSNG